MLSGSNVLLFIHKREFIFNTGRKDGISLDISYGFIVECVYCHLRQPRRKIYVSCNRREFMVRLLWTCKDRIICMTETQDTLSIWLSYAKFVERYERIMLLLSSINIKLLYKILNVLMEFIQSVERDQQSDI